MKMKNLSLVIVLLLATFLNADVKVNPLFSDNMVLQEGTHATVWGWADPGERVTVSANWGKSVSTNADKNGEWKVKLSTPEAGGPFTVNIKGKNEIKLDNVMTGQVWVCSGQSNMQFPVIKVRNGKQEVKRADYSKIRLISVKRDTSIKPQKTFQGKWSECSPDTIKNFSAVAYFFGRKLNKELDKPIGLINSSWGGTRIEAWTPLETLKNYKHALDYIDFFERRKKRHKEWKQKVEDWNEKDGSKPNEPSLPNKKHTPSSLFNAMINPLIPFDIKGVIWYQGEANRGNPFTYRELFPDMIKSCRSKWQLGKFPFYFVQITPHKGINPYIREAQLMTFSVQNTGMVVTTDIGNFKDIHPKNKQDVGKRLALWALAKDYGKSIVFSGPIYKSMEKKGGKILIHFKYTGSGLVAKDGKPLKEFEIAGEDRTFYPAKASIRGDSVIVKSDKVKDPVAVRFAFSNIPSPNLFNKEGLPASPFRTDNWPAEDKSLK